MSHVCYLEHIYALSDFLWSVHIPASLCSLFVFSAALVAISRFAQTSNAL